MSTQPHVPQRLAGAESAHAELDAIVRRLQQLADLADRNFRDYLLAEVAERWDDFDPESPHDRWHAAQVLLRGLDEGYDVDPSVESLQQLLNDLLVALDDAVSEEYGGEGAGVTVRSMRRVLLLHRELGAALEQWQQSLG